jgi:hypothetical protein
MQTQDNSSEKKNKKYDWQVILWEILLRWGWKIF